MSFFWLPFGTIMSWIYALSSCFRRTSVERIAEADQEAPAIMRLDRLPVEILQRIADFLPLNSAACLILSKKLFTLAIGHRSWVKLQSRQYRRERLRLLILMQRDLKEWVVCYHCELLHPVKRKPLSYTQWRDLAERPCSETDGIVEILPTYILRWQHARTIMKFHGLSPADTIWLDSLSHSIYRWGVPYAHCCARIANGDLLLKVEYRILLRDYEDFYHVLTVFPEVCPHWRSLVWDQNLARLIRCHMSHGTKCYSCAKCTGLIQCRWCATEFIVAFLDSSWSFNRSALYITAWKNLGPCQTPFDIYWRSHTGFMTIRYPPPNSPVYFTPDSIRYAFEELGSPKRRGETLASISPLFSDIEFAKRIEESSRRATQPKEVCESSEALVRLPELDFSSLPSLEEIIFSQGPFQ